MNGQSAAVIGGLLGLVAATALGVLRFVLAEGPEAEAQMLGNVAFALVYASPYLLTLVVSRTRDAAARGGLLMALGLLSWAASFSTFSLITVNSSSRDRRDLARIGLEPALNSGPPAMGRTLLSGRGGWRRGHRL